MEGKDGFLVEVDENKYASFVLIPVPALLSVRVQGAQIWNLCSQGGSCYGGTLCSSICLMRDARPRWLEEALLARACRYHTAGKC